MHKYTKKIWCENYFVFSLIRVDKEGLNILSLNVSNKAFGADKDGDNLNKILASLQYEGDIWMRQNISIIINHSNQF